MANKKYIKNVIKSFKNVVPDALGETLPGAKGLLDLVRNPAGEGYTMKETFSEIVGGYKEDFNVVKGIFGRFKKAAKTGNFYDENEMMEGLMGDMGGDFNFGSKDDDLFGDSADFNDSSFDDIGEEKAVNGGVTNNVTFVKDDTESASMITGAVASSSAHMVASIEKGTAVNFAVMNDINGRLVRMEEAQNKFYASNLELLSSIKSNLEAMVKINGAKETNLAPAQMERLFGDGSQEFNLRYYMRHLNKKMQGNDIYDMAKSFGPMMGPSMAMSMGVGYLLKKIPLMKTLEKMSKMMEGYGQILLNDMANVKGNGPISKLIRFFGVRTTASNRANLGKVRKGEKVDFDGETRESIIHVIPGYLAKMLNIMKNGRKGATDDTMEVYDMDKRQFRTGKSVKADKERKSESDLGWEIQRYIDLLTTSLGFEKGSKEYAEIKKAAIEGLTKMIRNGDDITNPATIKRCLGKLGENLASIAEDLTDAQVLVLKKAAIDAASNAQRDEKLANADKDMQHMQTNDELHKVYIRYEEYSRREYRKELEEIISEICGGNKTAEGACRKKLDELMKPGLSKIHSIDKILEELEKVSKIAKFKDQVKDKANARYNSQYTGGINTDELLKDRRVDKSKIDMSSIDDYGVSSMKEGIGKDIAEKAANLGANGAQKAADALDAGFNTVKDKASGAAGAIKKKAASLFESIFGGKKGGYASGGYTGNGNPEDIAGYVHKGEYVISNDELRSASEALGAADSGEMLIDPELMAKNKKKRLKFYERLRKADVSHDDAIILARMATEDPEAASAVLKEKKQIKKRRDYEAKLDEKGIAGAGHLGTNMSLLFKEEIANPIVRMWAGAKAKYQDGKLDISSVYDSVKDMLPGIGKGAGIGLAAGFFLPGGPLMGALAGGVIGAAKQNKAIRDYFLGDADNKDGKRGLIPKFTGILVQSLFGDKAGAKAEGNMKNFLNHPLQTLANTWKDPQGRKILINGATGGLLGSMFGPGGAILGMLAGGALGSRKQQSFFNRVMLGKRIVDKDGNVKGYAGGLWQSAVGAFTALVAGPAQTMLIGGSFKDLKPDPITGKIDPVKIRRNFAKGMAHLGASAATGGLLGSFFGPAGTLIGTLLGTTAGIRPVRAAARRIMFGKKDPNGKKFMTGGIFGNLFNLTQKAVALIPLLLTKGANAVSNPVVRFMLKALGISAQLVGKLFKLPGVAALGLGKLTGFFRKFYGGKYQTVEGQAFMRAVIDNPKSGMTEETIAMATGVLTSSIGELKNALISENNDEAGVRDDVDKERKEEKIYVLQQIAKLRETGKINHEQAAEYMHWAKDDPLTTAKIIGNFSEAYKLSPEGRTSEAIIAAFAKEEISEDTFNSLMGIVKKDVVSARYGLMQAKKSFIKGVSGSSIQSNPEEVAKNSFEAKDRKEEGNGINTAKEQRDETAKIEAAAAESEYKGGVKGSLEKLVAQGEEGKKHNRSMLDTISGIANILPYIVGAIGGNSLLDMLPFVGGKGGKGKGGKKPGRIKGRLGKVGGLFGILSLGTAAFGAYKAFSGDSPEEKVEGDDLMKTGARGIEDIALMNHANKITQAAESAADVAETAAEKPGLLSRGWNWFKSGVKKAGSKVVKGAKAVGNAVVSGVKAVGQGISNLYGKLKSFTQAFKELRSGGLIKGLCKFGKSIPIISGIFAAIEEIIAIHKFVSSKGDGTPEGTTISPRQRIITLIKDSSAALINFVMSIVSGVLMCIPPFGTAISIIFNVVDALLAFFSGESIADRIGGWIADHCGGWIADAFGWTEEKEAAWLKGEIDYSGESKAKNDKAAEKDIKAEDKRAAEENKRKAENEANSKKGPDVGDYIDEEFADVPFYDKDSDKPSLIRQSAEWTKNTDAWEKVEAAANPDFAVKTEEAILNPKDSIQNPFDYIDTSGSKDGNATFTGLNDETRNDLAHLGKMYYEKYGTKLKISSGKRSSAKQGDLWFNQNQDGKHLARWLTGKEKSEAFVYKTNFPGTSAHELGNAIDIFNSGEMGRKQIERLFGYGPGDHNMVRSSGGFKITDDSIVGQYNAAKVKNGGKPMFRASGKYRKDREDYNEHWHFQNKSDTSLSQKRWADSYDARVKAIDALDAEIKKNDPSMQLSSTIRDIYTSKELPEGKVPPQLIPGRGYVKTAGAGGTKGPESGDNMDESSDVPSMGSTPIVEKNNSSKGPSKTVELLQTMVNLLATIASKIGSSGSATADMLSDLFIPSSEALGNPNAMAINLLGSKLAVGI